LGSGRTWWLAEHQIRNLVLWAGGEGPGTRRRSGGGMTALDAVGPYEILRLLPDAEVRFVGAAPGPVTRGAKP
jgi:hypothetical protein